MRKSSFPSQLFSLVMLLSLALSACAQTAASPQAPAAGTAAESNAAAATTVAADMSAAPVTLRLALLPVLDALPIYVAQQEGLFAKHGVNVEVIPVGSAPERDQLIASGQADGIINEVVSTIFYNQEQTQVQIVRYAQTATRERALFRILAAPGSNITSAEGLKGVEIGISEGTVIEYLTDRLLQAEGFTADEIKGLAVPKITDRVALLSSGNLMAAMLPEPLSSLVVQQGATVALDDTSHPEYSFSTMTFRKAVIDEHPEAIRAFLAAWEEAVVLINADPNQWKGLLTELQLLPPPIADSFQVSQFVTAGVPSEQQWQDALAWTQEKGLSSSDVSYSESVNPSFLP